MKICKKCSILKPFSEYYAYKYSKDRLRYICKDCSYIQKLEYLGSNSAKQKQYLSKYKKSEKGKETNRLNFKKYYKTNPCFRLANLSRKRVTRFLQIKNWEKTRKFNEFIGCTVIELKEHLENQFKPGMTWENQGKNGWHIDHIKPLSLAQNEQELYELCHYTNLQPLWAIDNIKKGNKYGK